MNKFIFTLLAALTISSPALAAPAESVDATTYTVGQPQSLRFEIPKSINGVADNGAHYALPKRKIVEFSAAPVFIETGMGGVVALCLSSGAAGDYGVLYDTTSVSAIASALAGTEVAQSIAIDSVATNPYGSGASVSVNSGCRDYDPPLPFWAGLAAQMSAAHSRMTILYRLYRK